MIGSLFYPFAISFVGHWVFLPFFSPFRSWVLATFVTPLGSAPSSLLFHPIDFFFLYSPLARVTFFLPFSLDTLSMDVSFLILPFLFVLVFRFLSRLFRMIFVPFFEILPFFFFPRVRTFFTLSLVLRLQLSLFPFA